MLEIGVLADDLTGALASAARLRARGLRPAVVWSRGKLPPDADAVVVDMRTRDSGVEAEAIACEWAAHLVSLGCRRLEQRIDSALQGRPAEEIRGSLRGAGFADPVVLAVPAFPAAGRRTLRGTQHVELAGEKPRRIDVAATLFPGAEVVRLGAGELAAGPGAVRGALQGSARFVVADAADERELEALAAEVALLEADGVELLTVSPGAWLRYHPAAVAAHEDFVLVVVSSPTAQNRAQLERLRGRDGIVLVETLSAGASPERRPELAPAAARQAAAALARARGERRGCLGIVVSGGHTASCLADALEATTITPVGELQPLCALGVIRGGECEGLRIATKGGLVGSDGTLLELVEALGKEERR
jgi:uncharacterized protein YgbK (DUF1537 family)